MSRRPLGASLAPAERLVAYEAKIRAYQAAVAELEVAMEALDTVPPAKLAWAAGEVRAAFVGLQEVNAAPIRRTETVARRQTLAEPAR